MGDTSGGRSVLLSIEGKGIGLAGNFQIVAVGTENNGVQMHGLKILAFVTIRDDGIETADLGTHGQQPIAATNNSGPQFFAILDHEERIVGKAANDAVGTVYDQMATGLFEVFEKKGIGVFGQRFIHQWGDDVLEALDA